MRYGLIVDGVVVNVCEAPLPPQGWVEVPATVGPGHTFSGGVYTAPAARPPTRRITKLAFRNRFTDIEKLALYTAAESSVQLRVYLDDLAAAEFVDLDYGATVAGVQALEAAGIIGAGRAADILG
jgi:hypothetical protein